MPSGGSAGVPSASSGAAGFKSVGTPSGSRMTNSLPRPNSLDTVIRPPWSRTYSAVIARPSPVPPLRRRALPSSCVNFSNNRARSSGLMPTPVSATDMRAAAPGPPSGVSSAVATAMVTWP